MTPLLLSLALASGLWAGIAYGLASSHPTPSLTTLIPQVFIASLIALICLAGALVSAVASFWS